MLERLENFIKKYNLEDKTIIVGFSGGYDSMCLLDMLIKISKKADFCKMNIIAAHFNHNWRGDESAKEQEICRIFAKSKGIEFYTRTAQVPDKKNENEARILRYEFFEDAVDEFDADAVFTAHNKDDNAETIFYRIIKGTGIWGLKGISVKRGIFYRPLLTTYRRDILEYCRENFLVPNNDSSNADINYKRNYLRINIIPALEKINPAFKEALNTLSAVATNENSIIEEYLETIRPKIYNNEQIVSKEFIKLSKDVKLRIIYEFIQRFSLEYDYRKINDVYDFVEKNITQRNGSTMSLATALWLYVDNQIIETIPHKIVTEEKPFEIPIDREGQYNILDKQFIIKKYEEDKVFLFPEATANFMYVDLSEVEFPLTIRKRQDGDIIKPFGMTGTMKLKKFLNSKGIPRHKRDDVLLLASGSEVLWAIGVGLSNTIGVKEKPTHVIEMSDINQQANGDIING